MILFLINSKLISHIPVAAIKEFQHFYIKNISATKIYKDINKTAKIDDAKYEELKNVATDIINKFNKGAKK
jgi:F0F1-type ATP synthase alpha subunit